jgi:hypothetical protein
MTLVLHDEKVGGNAVFVLLRFDFQRLFLKLASLNRCIIGSAGASNNKGGII